VLRLDALVGELGPRCGLVSSHAFDLTGAIELGRALGRLPAALVVLGVEGACFDGGAPLSPAVRAALPAVVEAVRREVAALRAEARADA
jgi:hydrogenase maturation protease